MSTTKESDLRLIEHILTHWNRHKMTAIFQTTFSNAFSWMKTCEFRLKCHWSLFLRVQLTLFQHCFIQLLGADQATNHYLNQWRFIYWRIYASVLSQHVQCIFQTSLNTYEKQKYVDKLLREMWNHVQLTHFFNVRCHISYCSSYYKMAYLYCK